MNILYKHPACYWIRRMGEMFRFARNRYMPVPVHRDLKTFTKKNKKREKTTTRRHKMGNYFTSYDGRKEQLIPALSRPGLPGTNRERYYRAGRRDRRIANCTANERYRVYARRAPGSVLHSAYAQYNRVGAAATAYIRRSVEHLLAGG